MGNKVNTAFAYLPLSEERVVAELIRGRSVVDASYYPSTEPQHYISTDGVFALSEDIICTYVDLDSLIARTDMSPLERETIKYLMQGYSLPDIADKYCKSRQQFEILFKRAVSKIVKTNNADWEKWSGGRIDDD